MTLDIPPVRVDPTAHHEPRLLGRLGAMLFCVLMCLLVTSIAAPGVAAIGLFRTLPTLGVELPAYATYAEGDHAIMGRIAAGQALQPIFATAMVTTVVLAFTALLAWIAAQVGAATSFRRPSARVTNALLVLLCSLSLASVLSRGNLERTLDASLTSAREGNRAQADIHREQFDGLHRTAERLSQAQLAAALAAMLAGAAALLPRRSARS